MIKPNKRFLDDNDGVAALCPTRKSLASNSGNKLNRKLVVTVDSIKDNNGSLIENHKNHKVQQQQQQLLSAAAVSIPTATNISSSSVLCGAVSPKGPATATSSSSSSAATTSITDDDSSRLKGNGKDEDSSVSGSCSKLATITTSSNGKNKCDIKNGGGGGEADYNSDNLKGNLKRTDKEDKGAELERNKKNTEETQSGRCFFCFCSGFFIGNSI